MSQVERRVTAKLKVTTVLFQGKVERNDTTCKVSDVSSAFHFQNRKQTKEITPYPNAGSTESYVSSALISDLQAFAVNAIKKSMKYSLIFPPGMRKCGNTGFKSWISAYPRQTIFRSLF